MPSLYNVTASAMAGGCRERRYIVCTNPRSLGRKRKFLTLEKITRAAVEAVRKDIWTTTRVQPLYCNISDHLCPVSLVCKNITFAFLRICDLNVYHIPHSFDIIFINPPDQRTESSFKRQTSAKTAFFPTQFMTPFTST